MMYYYKRRTSPWRWAIAIAIILVMVGFAYWFYVNYFSKIEVIKSENINEADLNIIVPGQLISANLDFVQGDVKAKVNNKDYEIALKDTVLHQGDQIKTGANSLAIIKLESGSIVRLGENTEFILTSLDENNIIFIQNSGRSYYNLLSGKYLVKTLTAQIATLGTKFEVITNSNLNYVAVLALENKVKVDVLDKDESLLAVRLDPHEKVLLSLNSAKKDILKIENFNQQSLTGEEWYKWNFDLDAGKEATLKVQEPDFQAINDSLVLAAEPKDNGIYLSWSIYNKDDFKNYKIVRSEDKPDLKYPDDQVIKSSLDKGLNSYLDNEVTQGKKYYYRVCVLKINDKVACGNVANIQLKVEEKNATTPVAPNLTAAVYEAGVSLTWTANLETDFKEYRIIKSLTYSGATYPAESYLAVRPLGLESYLDKEVNITSMGNVYYRVCSLNTSNNVACSNVLTLENGQVK